MYYYMYIIHTLFSLCGLYGACLTFSIYALHTVTNLSFFLISVHISNIFQGSQRTVYVQTLEHILSS